MKQLTINEMIKDIKQKYYITLDTGNDYTSQAVLLIPKDTLSVWIDDDGYSNHKQLGDLIHHYYRPLYSRTFDKVLKELLNTQRIDERG